MLQRSAGVLGHSERSDAGGNDARGVGASRSRLQSHLAPKQDGNRMLFRFHGRTCSLVGYKVSFKARQKPNPSPVARAILLFGWMQGKVKSNTGANFLAGCMVSL